MQKQGPSRALSLVVMAVLLLFAVGWVARLVGESRLLTAKERFEAETGSLSLADYVLPPLEDAENAAVWLRAGAETLQMSDRSSYIIGQILDEEIGRWSPSTLEAGVSLITANEAALEQLGKCLGLGDSSFDFVYEEGFMALMPPMLELLRAGRLVAMDLRLALIDSDIERLSRDLEILDQLSRALARESFLRSAIMHLGVERLFLGAVRDVIAADLGNAEMLEGLRKKLEGRRSDDTLRRGIAGEAAAVLSAVELRGTFADSTGRGEQLRLWILEPFQLAALLDSYGDVVRSLEGPWIETLERSKSDEEGTSWAAHQFMLTNLLGAVEKLKAIELSQILAAQVVKLELVGAENGEFPERLDSELPDPYADGSVLYELSADGSTVLSARQAVDLWESTHDGADGRQRPILQWRVPPPSY